MNKTANRNYNGLKELFTNSKINVSFEFFPPKTKIMEKKLWDSIHNLKLLNPEFISVTYGAGGSTRERTCDTIKKILKETNLKPASHLTCVGSSKSEVLNIARNYWKLGVKHIVALRGDISPDYNFHPKGYKYANELVYDLRKNTDFEISVAGYPEKHPDSKNFEEDIDNLKRKVDSGANRIITQFFFDTDQYLRFIDRCRKANIETKIIPGILPITNFTQTKNFAKICNSNIPRWMEDLFSKIDNNESTRNLISATVAIEQCKILWENGVNNFHFYTLNKSSLILAICHVLGVKQEA